MGKIRKILIGTNNMGKYKEICALLPKKVIKYSLKEFKIRSPKETGKTYQENSLIKASYFSKKTNLVCLSDDSGLEINFLKGAPGVYSSRLAGKNCDFNLAISRIIKKMKKAKKKWDTSNKARFVCSLTIYWPSGKNVTCIGYVNGRISKEKKGTKGFGYDPIFIPNKYEKTFGELNRKVKMSIDHRFNAFKQIRNFF